MGNLKQKKENVFHMPFVKICSKSRYILSGEVCKQGHSKNYNKIKYHQFVHFSPNIRFPAL